MNGRIRRHIAFMLIFAFLFSIVSFNMVFADDTNYAVYSPAKKLDLWAVTHTVDGNKVAANTSVVASSSNTAFGGASAVLDGASMVGMQSAVDDTVTLTDRLDINGENYIKHKSRWTAGAKDSEQSLTFTFNQALLINELKWTEVRGVVGSFEVVCFKDNVETLRYNGQFTESITGTKLVLRDVKLPETVSADKVEIKFKTWLSSNVISIAEVEFWGLEKVAGLTRIKAFAYDGEVDLSENLEKAFDDNSETVYYVPEFEFDKYLEIEFDFPDLVIADTLYIDSDNIENIEFYGSIDNDKYFSIGGIKNGKNYTFLAEYIKSVRIKLKISGDLTLYDIGLYDKEENAEIHTKKSFFEGNDTSYITDEAINNITQPLKPLPDSLGNYTIKWRSSDSDIINVDTGAIKQSYVAKKANIYADFYRNEVIYKTNTYDVTIADDGTFESKNKLHYDINAKYENLSSRIEASRVWDANDYDPTYNTGGLVSVLYNESDKVDNFDRQALNSWTMPAMSSADYTYVVPITFQFDLDSVILLSNVDIYEFRNRLKKFHIDVSQDGESWTTASQNMTFDTSSSSTEEVYRKTATFSPCYAKYVRIVVDEIQQTTKSAALYLCEVVLYDTQAAPTIDGVGSIDIVDRNTDTFAEITDNVSMIFDLGNIDGFNAIKWTADGALIKDYEILSSNDGKVWNTVKENALENDDQIAEISFDYQICRYLKVNIKSLHTNEGIKISELYIMDESASNEYLTEKAFVNLIRNDATQILVNEELTLLTANKINIPKQVGGYDIIWDFSQAEMIDTETGIVAHNNEDLSGQIGVEVILRENNTSIYTNTFNIVSKPVFDKDNFYIAAQKETLLGQNFDFNRPNQFLFNQKSILTEFEITSNGKVSVKSDDELFNIEKKDTTITVTCGNAKKNISYMGGNVKVRAVIYPQYFDLYMNYDDTRYLGIISAGEYISENNNGIKSIEQNGDITKNIVLGIDKDYISDFLNQLNFCHISAENIYGVTQSLNLFNEIISLPVNWSSSNSNTISETTGAVNLMSEPCYVELVANINVPNVINWKKSLYASVNMPNIVTDGNVSVNAVALGQNKISKVTDGDLLTSFLTSYKNEYSISINFTEDKVISQIGLIEDNSQGSIKAYKIYVDDVEVYSGGAINGFQNCILDSRMGKVVRIEVISTEGQTGFKEIGIHSQITPSQKVQIDLNSVPLNTSYSSGSYTLPITGANGSTIAYSSNNGIVSFTEENGTVRMAVNNTGISTGVAITVTAKLGSIIKTKVFNTVIVGQTQITTQPNSSSGSSGGSSGGGFGGGVTYVPTGTTAISGDNIYKQTQLTDEISGHWGETEIRSLISKKIIVGDGNSYNLSKQVTRAEFITMLLRATEKQLSGQKPIFSDVSEDDWYADEMQTAYESGWIEGYGNSSYPNNNITREEMAVIICKALNLDISDDMQEEFTDKDEQSVWAINYINSLYAHKIISGYEDGTFRPKNELRRDEAMFVIYKLMNAEVE